MAQKTKVYDMYARFLRWAMDRIHENGIIAFVSNNSFIDSKTYDGFRKVLGQEFSCAYVINLKGNARTSGERRRQEGGNIFRDKIRVGVAIYFLVKEKTQERFQVFYDEVKDYAKADEKSQWLSFRRIRNIPFEYLRPDKKNYWINIPDNDFESLMPLCKKNVKLGRCEEALFELYSLGVVTARDEWSYDFTRKSLKDKTKFFIKFYNNEIIRWKKSKKNIPLNDFVDRTIKWTQELESHLSKQHTLSFNDKNIILSNYRPFVKKLFYFDRIYTHRIYQNEKIFGFRNEFSNTVLCISGMSTTKPFNVLASNILVDLHFNGDSQCLPLYHYDQNGKRIDNITDWGLQQFVNHYKDKKITKQKIFHYVYAVLHDPAYRRKYELNLKREFPRIPFYDDFHQWANWGKRLTNLHINYETAKPYRLQVKDLELPPGVTPKVKLKADKDAGIIILDSETELRGVPAEAWQYKLGNRSALEWILDQYLERKPQDPTIAEKFDTYRFADYKEQVMDLLQRVCTVSVETMKIMSEMEMTYE